MIDETNNALNSLCKIEQNISEEDGDISHASTLAPQQSQTIT